VDLPSDQELRNLAHRRVLKIWTFGLPADPFVFCVDSLTYNPDGTVDLHRRLKTRKPENPEALQKYAPGLDDLAASSKSSPT
jgi:hypothetical protein